jgi:hypothetical protein
MANAKRKILLVSILAGVLVSCMTPNETVVVPGTDLSSYENAVLPPGAGDAGLIRMEAKIHNALAAAGFNMYGEKEAESLSEDEQARTVLIRYSISQSHEESVVSINIYDYRSDRLLANCTGAFSMGFTMEHDLRVASESAYRQLEELLAESRGAVESPTT